MKKIITAIILAISSSALAGPHHGHNYGHRHNHHRHWHSPPAHHWVAPLIIGGVVGAAIANNRSQIHQPLGTQSYSSPSNNVTSITCPFGSYLTEETAWYKDQFGRTQYGTIYRCN